MNGERAGGDEFGEAGEGQMITREDGSMMDRYARCMDEQMING